jgi:hypothetical protein
MLLQRFDSIRGVMTAVVVIWYVESRSIALFLFTLADHDSSKEEEYCMKARHLTVCRSIDHEVLFGDFVN